MIGVISSTLREELPARALAVSPLDGRYYDVGELFAPYFSEYALMGYRFHVMMGWLIRFLKETHKHEKDIERLIQLQKNEYSPQLYLRIKLHEAVTNHDVKSVEYAIRDILKEHGMMYLSPYIHIGCTSEDVNNLAYAMMCRDALRNLIQPKQKELIEALATFAYKYRATPMLGFTHGQPAIPTTVGKEFANFVSHLGTVYEDLRYIPITGKLNGAVGNYSALAFAYPEYDWEEIAASFVCNDLGLGFEKMSTQIDLHDWNVQILQNFELFGMIMKKLVTDIWEYISKEMISQIPRSNEVGSSTMPQKINPIRFENAEAHLKLLGMIESFNRGLKESRMQRDLSDSALQRYIGEIFGMFYKAIDSTLSGLKRIQPNTVKLNEQLDKNPSILAEAIQTKLRKNECLNAYDQLRELTRGQEVTLEILRDFVTKCDDLSEEDKEQLLALTPQTYLGYAERLTVEAVREWIDISE